jgi:hypothetical protein
MRCSRPGDRTRPARSRCFFRGASEFVGSTSSRKHTRIGVSWQVLARRAEIHLARAPQPGRSPTPSAPWRSLPRSPTRRRGTSRTRSAHHVFVAARREQAAQLTREVIDDLLQAIPPSFAVIALPALASTALRLGLLPELIAALEKHMPTPWREVVRRYAAATTSPPPTCSARLARNPARPRPASTPRGSSRPPAVTTKPASNCSRPSPSTAPSVRRATWTRSSRF